MEKMDAVTLQRGLDGFCGTEEYHRWSPLFRRHVLTDGVKFLCEHGGDSGAYWLADLIASYHAKAMQDAMLRDMQFWTLKVDLEKHTAIAICERDTGNVAFQQKIPYTDFQLAEIKLYVAPSGSGDFVILLPNEY